MFRMWADRRTNRLIGAMGQEAEYGKDDEKKGAFGRTSLTVLLEDLQYTTRSKTIGEFQSFVQIKSMVLWPCVALGKCWPTAQRVR